MDGPVRPAEGTVRWPATVSSILCVAGVAVAGYLTYAHYTSAKVLACSDKGLVNCAKVTTSSYSRIFGIPVSDTGLIYFIVMGALCSPWAWRSANAFVRRLRVAGAVAGVGMILWLIFAELFRLDAICLYCTIVHGITLLLFITIALGTAATAPSDDSEDDEQSPHPVGPPTRFSSAR